MTTPRQALVVGIALAVPFLIFASIAIIKHV